MNLMDVLDKKETLRQSANFSEVPAGFIQMLAMGTQSGQAQPLPEIRPQEIKLPAMNMQAPQVDMPDLAGMQNANTQAERSQFEQDKYNQGQKDLADSGKLLSSQIGEQLQGMEPTNPIGKYLSRLKAMADSNNPVFAKAALEGFSDYNSAAANNLQTTAEEKNLANAQVQNEVRRKENLGPVPSGATRDDNGVITYAPMSTGGNYGDVLSERSMALKNMVTPIQQQQLGLAQEANTRANDAAKRAEDKAMLDEKRYQNSLIKDINPTHRMAYTSNLSTLKQIDDTLKLIDERPESFGLKFSGGDTINQRLDPKGVKYRSAVSQIASVKRHDISGAAVSPSEDKYLKPWLPNETDTAEAAKEKLLALRANIAGVNNDISGMYKEGYRQALPPTPKDPYTLDKENRTVNGTLLNFTSAVPKEKHQAILDAIKSGKLDVEEGRKRGYIQ